MENFNSTPSVQSFWRSLWLGIAIVLCLFTEVKAQLPDPYMYLPLEANDPAYDLIRKNRGTFSLGVSGATDRFGRINGCVQFNGKGANVDPSDLQGFSTGTITSSFWTYIDDPSSIPDGENPFRSGDVEQQVYGFYRNHSGDPSNSMVNYFGIARKGATVGNQRLIQKKDAAGNIQVIPWYFWRNRPIQFDQQGWYHVVVVCTPKYNRIHMYKPDKSHHIGYDYLTTQKELLPTFNFSVGARGANNPIKYLDDFRLYTVALTDDQVEMLHNQEKVHAGTFGVFRLKNVKSGLYLTADYGVDYGTDKDAMIKSENNAGASLLWKINFPSSTNADFIQWMGDYGNQKNLNIYNGSTADNAKVATYGSWDPNAKWFFRRNPDGSYLIENAQTSTGLATDNGGTAENTLVRARIQVQADQSDRWIIEQVDLKLDEGYYRFKNRNSGLYFATGELQFGEGFTVTDKWYFWQAKQRDENDAGAMNIWKVTRQGYNNNSWYNYWIGSITNADKFWPIAGTSYSALGQNRLSPGMNWDDRAPIYTGDWGYVDELKWLIWKDTQGYYRIASYKHAKFLVVADASQSPSAEIVQNGAGQANSQWTIERVDMNPIRRDAIGSGYINYFINNIAKSSQNTVRTQNGNNQALFLGEDIAGSPYSNAQLFYNSDQHIYSIATYGTYSHWNLYGYGYGNNVTIGTWDNISPSSNDKWYIYRDSQSKLRIASAYSLQYARTVLDGSTYWVRSCCNVDGIGGGWNQWSIVPTTKRALEANPAKSYKITHVATGKALDVSQFGDNWVLVSPWVAPKGSLTQNWSLTSDNDGSDFFINNKRSNYALDMYSNSVNLGTWADIYPQKPVGSDANQRWILSPTRVDDLGRQIYTITNKNSGLCLGLYTNPRTLNAFQYTCGGTSPTDGRFDQEWYIDEITTSGARVATAQEEIKQDELPKLNVYPNPTEGILNVDLILEQFSNVNFELFSVTGAKVFEKQERLATGMQHVILNISHLKKSGIATYVLTITDETGRRIANRSILVE